MRRAHGVDVLEHEADNDGVRPLDTAWSRALYEEIAEIGRRFRRDSAHVHNFRLKLESVLRCTARTGCALPARVPSGGT